MKAWGQPMMAQMKVLLMKVWGQLRNKLRQDFSPMMPVQGRLRGQMTVMTIL
jgi:hypothetical protein